MPTVRVCPPSKLRVAEKRKGNDPSLLYSHADHRHRDTVEPVIMNVGTPNTFYCGAVSPMQPGQTFVFSAFIIIVLVRVLMQ